MFFLQIPYGFLIALSILACVYFNDRFENRRCVFILIFLIPNLVGAFRLRFVPTHHGVGGSADLLLPDWSL